MSPKLFHIYGPLAIHAYGTAIACGLTIFLWLIRKDSRLYSIVSPAIFDTIVTIAIIAGILGGRLLHVLVEWKNMCLVEACMPWVGGFSILGTILALATTIPMYLYCIQVPILPLLDLAAVYAPLMQAISRLGCFFAGCCYGQPSKFPWAVTYNDQNALAPCFIPLHPTQLYSSMLLFGIFLVLYLGLQKKYSKPGQILCFYLIGISLERAIVDFWRADRIFNSLSSQILSIHQLIACGILVGACGMLVYFSYKVTR